MEVFEWLTGPAGTAAINAAGQARTGRDSLSAATELRRRRPDLSPEQCAAALDQAALREEAARRYGLPGEGLLLTRDGLEQATRPEVARQRAELFVQQGARRVVDLTAGLGLDAAAFCAAGLDVTAVERDPVTAAFCAVNVPAAAVVVADATDPTVLADLLDHLTPSDVVFVDPARRSGVRDLTSHRARPERDPERWSPPWSFVAGVDHPRIAVKTAPGFNPPDGWCAQWSSVDHALVEAMVMSWPALPAATRAVCHAQSGPEILEGPGRPLPVAAQLGDWLIEPDPAVVRAGLAGALAARAPTLASVDPDSSWLNAAEEPTGLRPLARVYRVEATMPANTKQARRFLQHRGITRLTIKNKDVGRDPHEVLRELGCREGDDAVLVQLRAAGRTLSCLVDPVRVPRA